MTLTSGFNICQSFYGESCHCTTQCLPLLMEREGADIGVIISGDKHRDLLSIVVQPYIYIYRVVLYKVR